MLERTKIVQQPQANFSGFFGMKLHSEQLILLDCGREPSTVFAASHRCPCHGRTKGVREIYK
jgi:hypothetical protein